MKPSYKEIKLVLEDGTTFNGYSFGAEESCAGEVVFYTGMVGYPESLTDPSYAGQILVSTSPMVGNYGVPSEMIKESLRENFESDKIHARGFVICDYSMYHSHWNAERSLHEWLAAYNVPGIFGIDTRKLTKILREKGSMLGKIVVNKDLPFEDTGKENFVAQVSTTEVVTYGSGGKKVVLVDCGVKYNIIRCLLSRGVTVIRVPWDYDYTQDEYDGVFLSNGPGDPQHCQETVRILQKAMQQDKPIMGICLGNQLLARAAGAKTYKMKFGHRSHNQPVLQVGTQQCFITPQNHGYAIEDETLPSDWRPLFINANDQTNEGIEHKTKPFFSVQFHPEATSGPVDTEFLFKRFIDALQD